MTKTHVFNTNRINVYCDEKLVNLRLRKHFELALPFLSDAVKLEKVVCEWVCMLWVGGFRQKPVVWIHISKHECWFGLCWKHGFSSFRESIIIHSSFASLSWIIMLSRNDQSSSGLLCSLRMTKTHVFNTDLNEWIIMLSRNEQNPRFRSSGLLCSLGMTKTHVFNTHQINVEWPNWLYYHFGRAGHVKGVVLLLPRQKW